jgi:hypothetical protein
MRIDKYVYVMYLYISGLQINIHIFRVGVGDIQCKVIFEGNQLFSRVTQVT